jgi:hypothetical protein
MDQQEISNPKFKSSDPLGFIRFILSDVANKAKSCTTGLSGSKYDASAVEAALKMADLLEAEAVRLRGIVRHNEVEPCNGT